MQKFVIVKMLENKPEGSIFESDNWPLHVTVVPNFEIDCNYDNLKAELLSIVSPLGPALAQANNDDFFGPNNDILVTRLEPTPKLALIHNTIVDFLEKQGAVFELPIRLRSDYKPHVTVHINNRIYKGDVVNIDELSIVGKATEGSPSLRKVLGGIKLAE